MSSKAELSELSIPNSNLDFNLLNNANTDTNTITDFNNLGFNLLTSANSNAYTNTITDSNPSRNTNPNFVNAQGNTIYLNYSQSASATLTSAQADTLVKGGVGIAIAEAQASFFNSDPTFSSLFTEAGAIGLDGQVTSSSNSATEVLASFTIGANQSFSFEFSTDLALTAKEIENPKVEYNKAQSKSAFVVLDTTNPNQPIVLDYFGLQGN
jgi:serralysin